jgi:hypothetical protein
MSGRRHHYLPIFLQKSFRSKSARKEDYVCAHERERSFETNTRNLGVEHDFYGKPEDGASDAAITRAETAQADCVQRLLADDSDLVPSAELARLIAFTSLRTRRMLDTLRELAPKYASMCESVIRSKDMVRTELTRTFNDPGRHLELVELHHSDYPNWSPSEQESSMVRWRTELERRRESQPEETIKQVGDLVEVAIRHLLVEAAMIAERNFKAVFAEDPTLENRSAIFRKYCFEIQDAGDDEFFILGDCAVVAIDSRRRARLALMGLDDKNKIETIFLPLSPRRCLVGHSSVIDAKHSVSEINGLSAMLSRKFFVSHLAEHLSFDGLKSLIGTARPLYPLDDLTIDI